MRARIGTLARRLGKVETATLTTDGERRGGVMLIPPIEYDFDAWERIAMAEQAALSQACREDLPLERNLHHEDERGRGARVASSLRS